jgi:transcriptional regulator with XRE-family HTH domain
LTLEAVACRCRLQLSALALFENGEAIPDVRQLVTIASVLQTTPDAILAGVRWDQDQMRFEVEPPHD